MVDMRKELLLGISIPIIFTLGFIAFVYLIPAEYQTLDNFISYTSSLSTILMVLVVIVTTSLQLKEMQSTKLLQTQPFPTVTPLDKSRIEKLTFFYSYPESKTLLYRRLFFFFSVENIGNAPIVALDIIPKLRFVDDEGKTRTVEEAWERIDSLKPDEKREVDVMFREHGGTKPSAADYILKRSISDERPCEKPLRPSSIELTILYKNVIGANFKQRMLFDIYFYGEDMEIIKSCLKLSETAKIDFAETIKTLDSLMKRDEDKGNEMINELNEDLSAKSGCKGINFAAVSRRGAFSVNPISEKEYQEHLQTRTYETTIWLEKPKQKQNVGADLKEGTK